ncbi:MAG: oxidoreductase [Ferruginibacter sp.]
MKTALIVGGTGLIGKELTSLLLEDDRYAQIILLVRKRLDITHKKLIQLVYDFDRADPSAVLADEIFCCLGTTIKVAGSKAAFYKVDHDYVINIAKAGFANGVKKFALVSSMGANKNSPIFYSRTKGETEQDVMAIAFESLYIFRPSLLLGTRPGFRLGEKISQFLMVNLSFIIPAKYKAVQGRQVAQAMINVMNNGQTGMHIFESDRIAKL